MRTTPQLYVPSLLEGKLSQATFGTHLAFEAINDQGEIRSSPGLKNFIYCHPELDSGSRQSSAPLFLFDNHNHAFYFWHYFASLHPELLPLTLVHIDQHRDSRQPASFLTPEEAKNLDLVFNYTQEILNVGNFIPPALKTGIINQIINLDSEQSLLTMRPPSPSGLPRHGVGRGGGGEGHHNQENLTNAANQNFILDIDLDFFVPDLDYIPLQLKIDTIKLLLPQASLITIATSPFFIDQELALSILPKVFPSQLQ